MKGFLTALLFSLFFPNLALFADVRAFVDRNAIGPEESIQLTVTSKGSEADVDTSPIKDFKIMSRGTSSSVQIINGKISREVSYNFLLFPLGEGRLTIPPLTVTADEKTYQTQPIVVMVSEKPQRNDNDITDTIFVEASVSDVNPFEGQQIVYTFKLFHQVQIANPTFQKPDFSGFTAKETGQQTSYSAIISGRQYEVTAVSYVLIPINAGEKIIEPATLQCDVLKPRQNRRRFPFDSFFDDPFFGRTAVEPKIFRTKSLTIRVKSLPPYNGNGTFSGLVGQFDIDAQLDNSSLHVGDSTTLSVVIKGKGNIMDAEEPSVTIPEGFKTYKDTPQENVQVDSTGYSGQKTFRIALVPVASGNFVLPPVQLSYFDVSKDQYLIRSTPAISLKVMPAKEKESLNTFSSLESPLPPIKNKVEFSTRDILPLYESPDALQNQNTLSWLSFLLLLMTPACFYLGMRGMVALMQKEDNPAVQMAKRSETALKNARRTCKSDSSGMEDVFFTHLYRALVSIILSKANMIGESLTYREAETLLRSRGYSKDMCKKASQLLEKIESARFGGYAREPSSKQDLYDETKSLMRSFSRK